MSVTRALADSKLSSLSGFMVAPELRADIWMNLLSDARHWAADGAITKELIQSRFDELENLEMYFAYPGKALLQSLKDRVEDNDSKSFLRLAQAVSTSIIAQKYLSDENAWEIKSSEDSRPADRLPQALSHTKNRPYFEVLSVVPHAMSRWNHIIKQARAVRRSEDEFIYETVVVGNAEDALTAILMNSNINAVVLYEGFSASGAVPNPLLDAVKDVVDISGDIDEATLAFHTAQAIKKIRPELDLYFLSDRDIETLAGREESRIFSRLFYQVEEPLELHLSILEGVRKRFKTPFFDNLKHYAERPIATFHALPIARGKAVFKSNWIRDMGEFYGPNLFLAESSATTGGLDSLLEPTGNIKEAQDMAARAFGADQVFFVTNGTSTSNKIVLQALLSPGDIVIIDRNCHKSHHYGCVLAGAQPYYVEAFPLKEYSMYGAVPLQTIKQALLTLKSTGLLNKVKIVDLTNCTFDGHVYNTLRVMQECLAIKPDLIFLWDEAWFGFAHWSPLLRGRTAMGAAENLKNYINSPSALEAWEKQQEALGQSPSDDDLLNARLVPDPRAVKIRVYQTNSTHKSMSSLRQGSMILVNDVDYNTVEAQFHEAVFTHASTSPNLQIIASLDVARRQMELEGYGLVANAIRIAFEIRKQVNTHPIISKYFKVLTNGDMIPADHRQSGLSDYNDGMVTWSEGVHALLDDEFILDPTRITLACGHAGFDGTSFKNLLADKFNIQLNKTSRNSVLLQSNINNSRSDIALLIRVLLDIATEIDGALKHAGEAGMLAFSEKVRILTKDVPDLPNFSKFADRYRTNPSEPTLHGDIRSAFYDAYKHEDCEYVPLHSAVIDQRIAEGPELISANFVIPYPPGFPIMVPGQVITHETIEFMRKLDVKEIHGYNKDLGIKLIKA